MLAVFPFSGCADRNTGAETSDPQSSVSVEEAQDGEGESQPEEEKETDPMLYEQLAGVYVYETKGVDRPYWPALELKENGSCNFTVNLLSSIGHIEGHYTVEDNSVLVTVDQVDFEGFAADDVESLRFDISAGNTLVYRGSIEDETQAVGMTNPYDLFKLEKQGSSAGEDTQSTGLTVTLQRSSDGNRQIVDDPELAAAVIKLLEGQKPLSDTDDQIEKREDNPSITISVQEGNSSYQLILFPGTPASLEEEITVVFGTSGQYYLPVAVFEEIEDMFP